VRVRDGQIVEERHWLIRPPEKAETFDSWNVAIHGITAEQVANAPRWRDILPDIVRFVGNDVLVAHNAAFDTGVIRYACAIDEIETPEITFLCTLVAVRKALQLPSYRLPFVVESLGLSLDNHHDALSDARAVAQLLPKLVELRGVSGIQAFADDLGVGLGLIGPNSYRGSAARRVYTSKSFSELNVNVDADPDGYLFGRVVVFTGTLKSMSRDDARQECARMGALPEANTTKRTNVLVVGDIDSSTLRPGTNLSGKTRKAFDLQEKGQQIEVMTEDEFLRCIEMR